MSKYNRIYHKTFFQIKIMCLSFIKWYRLSDNIITYLLSLTLSLSYIINILIIVLLFRFHFFFLIKLKLKNRPYIFISLYFSCWSVYRTVTGGWVEGVTDNFLTRKIDKQKKTVINFANLPTDIKFFLKLPTAIVGWAYPPRADPVSVQLHISIYIIGQLLRQNKILYASKKTHIQIWYSLFKLYWTVLNLTDNTHLFSFFPCIRPINNRNRSEKLSKNNSMELMHSIIVYKMLSQIGKTINRRLPFKLPYITISDSLRLR